MPRRMVSIQIELTLENRPTGGTAMEVVKIVHQAAVQNCTFGLWPGYCLFQHINNQRRRQWS